MSTAGVLEFIADPHGTCERMARVELINRAASIQVSDEDAALARAGAVPTRRFARLPFLLPGVRPGTSS